MSPGTDRINKKTIKQESSAAKTAVKIRGNKNRKITFQGSS
jgi:hypothetical protein